MLLVAERRRLFNEMPQVPALFARRNHPKSAADLPLNQRQDSHAIRRFELLHQPLTRSGQAILTTGRQGGNLVQCSNNCSHDILFPPNEFTLFLNRLSSVTSVKRFFIAVSAISASRVLFTYDFPASGLTQPRIWAIRFSPVDHFALFHFDMFQTADSVETKPSPRAFCSSRTTSLNIRQSFVFLSAHNIWAISSF